MPLRFAESKAGSLFKDVVERLAKVARHIGARLPGVQSQSPQHLFPRVSLTLSQ